MVALIQHSTKITTRFQKGVLERKYITAQTQWMCTLRSPVSPRTPLPPPSDNSKVRARGPCTQENDCIVGCEGEELSKEKAVLFDKRPDIFCVEGVCVTFVSGPDRAFHGPSFDFGNYRAGTSVHSEDYMWPVSDSFSYYICETAAPIK